MKSKIMIIASIILCSNLPPLSWAFSWFDPDDCKFSNGNASFTFEEFQFHEREFTMAKDGFVSFKCNCECDDTILYRINIINPLKFWWYGDYLFKEKYNLPYKSWDSISAKRKPIKIMGVQDF